MEYALVEAGSAAELQEKVTARMADGWMPAGGVAVTYHNNGGWHFCQAVVLLPDEPDDGDEE